MKVVFTVSTYYPLKDGVQAVTQYHAESLAQKGHDVTVITAQNGSSPANETYNGVQIIRYSIVTKQSFYYGDKKGYQNLIISECSNADALINVCTQNPFTDWIMPILCNLRCKKLLYVHGMFDKKLYAWDFDNIAVFAHKIWNKARWGLYYQSIGKYLKEYDHVVQLHQFDLANRFFERKYSIQGNVIGNAADEEFFSSYQTSIGENIKNRYAIYVANYMDRKNQESALRAFYDSKIDMSIGLIFIGSQKNEYCDKLVALNKELSNKYGERNVKILHGIERAETIRYIANASLYLMSSRWEAFPVSIIESMAAGIPFISTDVGCVRFLPGGTIATSEKEMSYWIEFYFNNENIRRRSGEIGHEYAEKYLRKEYVTTELEALLL